MDAATQPVWAGVTWLREVATQVIESVVPPSASLPPPPPPPPPALRLAPGVVRAIAAVGWTAVALWTGVHFVRHWRRASRRSVAPLKRTQCVLVLGGDTPLGQSVVEYLLAHNLIVLASVSSAASARALEARIDPEMQGYVRTIQLHDATSFVHAVHASLCLRYPWTATGDPYARPGQAVEWLGTVNTLGTTDTLPDVLQRLASLRPHRMIHILPGSSRASSTAIGAPSVTLHASPHSESRVLARMLRLLLPSRTWRACLSSWLSSLGTRLRSLM